MKKSVNADIDFWILVRVVPKFESKFFSPPFYVYIIFDCDDRPAWTSTKRFDIAKKAVQKILRKVFNELKNPKKLDPNVLANIESIIEKYGKRGKPIMQVLNEVTRNIYEYMKKNLKNK